MPFTREEHLLLLTITTRQYAYTKMILEILKSREIVTAEDVPAFEFAVVKDAASTSALFLEAKAAYIQLARGLGMDVPDTL